MTVAILSLAGSVIGFLLWLWKRKVVNADDKFKQHEQRVKKAQDAVADGDSKRVDDRLDESLRWLHDHENNPGGQSGNSPGTK